MQSFVKYITKMNYVPRCLPSGHESASECMPLPLHVAEKSLGFPKDHTQGGPEKCVLVSEADRRKSLGETFDVETIMYLTSPWKQMQAIIAVAYPDASLWAPNGAVGISMYDGIAAGPLAIFNNGIRVKRWIIVESSHLKRRVATWWLRSKGFVKYDNEDLRQRKSMPELSYEEHATVEDFCSSSGFDIEEAETSNATA
eukprot:gene9588-11356_t